ncbi:hypothetical protein ACJX0J_025573, partial [Zea mays]
YFIYEPDLFLFIFIQELFSLFFLLNLDTILSYDVGMWTRWVDEARTSKLKTPSIGAVELEVNFLESHNLESQENHLQTRRRTNIHTPLLLYTT